MPGTAGSDEVAVAGQGVQNEDGVVARGGEFAPGLVGDPDVGEVLAALEREGADAGELPVAGRVALTPGAARRRLAEERPGLRLGDETRRRGVCRCLPLHRTNSVGPRVHSPPCYAARQSGPRSEDRGPCRASRCAASRRAVTSGRSEAMRRRAGTGAASKLRRARPPRPSARRRGRRRGRPSGRRCSRDPPTGAPDRA